MRYVCPDSLPQHLDGTSRTVFLKDAGAAELEKAQSGVAVDEAFQVELVLGIESAAGLGDFLPEQAVGSDDAAVFRSGTCGVEDQEMVARIIEPVGVARDAGRL